MIDFLAQLDRSSDQLRVGPYTLTVTRRGFFAGKQLGVQLSGYAGEPGPVDYLNDLLLTPRYRESSYRLVDQLGLLVCRGLPRVEHGYRDVRGRSSRGRLSPGEYYHHDGCSGPHKPRVVEIHLPARGLDRDVATAIAPFRACVLAMLRHAKERLQFDTELQGWHAHVLKYGEVPADRMDTVQGLVTRCVRRSLSAEDARDFFRTVDHEVDAFFEPWERGESRLISNAHPHTGAVGTMQHRRAYQAPHCGGKSQGKLVKRWPAEELL